MLTAIKNWRVNPLLIGGLLGANLIWFGQQYFIQAPRLFARQWGYGTKQAVLTALAYEDKVDKIIFTDAFKQPYIYVLFYGHPQPEWLASVNKQRHKSLGYQVLGKYQFRPVRWEEDKLLTQTLIVGSAEEIPEDVTTGKEIVAPGGEVVFRIVKT